MSTTRSFCCLRRAPMWDSFVSVLLNFKWIILLTVIAGLGMAAVAMRLSKELKWDQKRWKFLGIFAGLRSNEILWLAFLTARYVFTAVVVVVGMTLRLEHLYIYVLLCLGCMLLIPRIKRIALELINSVVVYASLLVSNMLLGYLKEVRSDELVRIISILLAVFLIVYTTYFLLKNLAEMLQDRKRTGVA